MKMKKKNSECEFRFLTWFSSSAPTNFTINRSARESVESMSSVGSNYCSCDSLAEQSGLKQPFDFDEMKKKERERGGEDRGSFQERSVVRGYARIITTVSTSFYFPTPVSGCRCAARRCFISN